MKLLCLIQQHLKKNYNPKDYFDQKQSKRLDRSSQLGIIAAREAVKDSNITKENTDFDRVGTFVSSGIAGLTTIQEQCKINFEKGNINVMDNPIYSNVLGALKVVGGAK